jgi:undecaprenyl-diphosphatase
MQLDLWQILLLACVQGLTEFLPISSSGHLVVLSAWLAAEDPSRLEVADLNVVLHLGTLLSIVVFYWHRLRRLAGEDRNLIVLLLIGTVPAVVVGLTIKLMFEHWVENALLAGLMLPITGLLLVWSSGKLQGRRECAQLTARDACLIGLSQAAAILPGLSRSGTTISAGLALGLAPRAAATFSFLLAIPAIGGAGLLTAVSLATKTEMSSPWQHLVLGGIIAFVVGLFSLSWLIRWLEQGRLWWFAWWCIPLGICVTLWQLTMLAGP